LQDSQRSAIAFDMLLHPAVEARLVDPVPLLDRFGAGKLLIAPDAFGHGVVPFRSSPHE
jgi:hypothetical protein